MYKVNDIVELLAPSRCNAPEFATVARTTATQVILDNGRKFSQKSRREVGVSSHFACGISEPITEQQQQAIEQDYQDKVERERLAAFLRQFEWWRLPLKKLRIVKAAIS